MAPALVVLARGASGETVVTAGSTSATWTAAESPYIVTGALSFDTLRVEAGTIVRAATADPFAIEVSELIVRGTKDAPVIFEKDGGGSMVDTWGGIRATTFDVEGAVFRNAEIALFGGAAPTTSRVSDSVFEANHSAIEIRGPLVVERVAFAGNGTALFGGPTGTPYSVSVTNGAFRGGNGLVFVASPAEIRVESSTFHDVNGPLAASRPAFANNSVFSSCRWPGTAAAVTVSNSTWFPSGAPTYVALDASVLREDPAFVSATDLRLSPASPCIDSGSATGAPDRDIDGNPRPIGNGFDMGAYEFSPDDDGGEGGEGGSGSGGEGGNGTTGGTGGASGDAGAPTGGIDGGALGGSTGAGGGTAGSGGSGSTGDGGTGDSGSNAGRRNRTVKTTGCGCRTLGAARPNDWFHALVAAAFVGFAARRRRHARRGTETKTLPASSQA